MADLFSSKAARNGAVIRRKLRDIDRYVGLERFSQELARRGYQAVMNAGQMVIFCNREPIHLLQAPLSCKESGPETFKVSGSRREGPALTRCHAATEPSDGPGAQAGRDRSG